MALIQAELESSSLVRILDQERPAVTVYSLAYRECDADDPKVRAFRDWVFDEVRDVCRPPLRVVAAGSQQ